MTECQKTIEIKITVKHHDECFSEHHGETLNWSSGEGMANWQHCFGVHLSDAVMKVIGEDHANTMIRCFQEYGIK